jgi:hypothetical protein
MGLLHFVEEQDTPSMGLQDLPKPPVHPGFITKEELHAIEMLKLRHVEAMERPVTKKIP